MKTLFYFQDIKQAEEFATKLCKCGIFCEWKHNYAVEVPNFRNMLIDTQEMIFSVAKQYSSYYQCDYSAKKRFAQMNVERCINYWNIVGGDNYHSLHEIHEMDNEDYWKKIGEELGSYSLMQAICNSENHFDQRKLYVGYIEDNNSFFSFNTKEELLEYITEDWFIENLMNE